MAKGYDEAEVDFEAWVDATAPVLGMQVKGLDREAVIANLRLLRRHAAAVDEFPLPDEAEPAPVFFVEDPL
jgi:hypothetical protein